MNDLLQQAIDYYTSKNFLLFMGTAGVIGTAFLVWRYFKDGSR